MHTCDPHQPLQRTKNGVRQQDIAYRGSFFSTNQSYNLSIDLNGQLGAQETLYVVERNQGTGSELSIANNIPFVGSGGGAVLLCENNNCVRRTNIVDAVFYANPHVANRDVTVGGITFENHLSPLASENTQSYLRKNFEGDYPSWLNSDWEVGSQTRGP